jgi:hypothetical protein
MLRRIPFTPLVSLVIFLSTIILNASWAAGPDESLEILLKPNQSSVIAAPAVPKANSRFISKVAAPQAAYLCVPPPPPGISKIKSSLSPVYEFAPPCILPAPRMSQWEMSFGVIFANMGGYIGWPRYSLWYWGWLGNTENRTDFNTGLQLPIYAAWPTFTASYHFRPNWALRYSVLWNQINGGGWPQDYVLFGPQWGGGFFYGWNIQTIFQHAYHRVGLVYDAIHTCGAKVSVFADWVHTDTKIAAGCPSCGYWYTPTWSNSVNAAMAGLEFQSCIKTAPNGGSLSWDMKAGGIFLDDTVGADVEAAARYSIPLNCGRAGYVKGGYRFVNLKKTQYDFVFNNTLQGGFVEGGFIF